MRSIELRGIEVHNLKKIDLDLPLGALIVVSGVSGAGKSSLALDTLFAEGRRRYIETFSARTRAMLETVEKPAATRISGIPASIAVTATPGSWAGGGGATVATISEIDMDFSILFTRIGKVVCQSCGAEIGPRDPAGVASWIDTLADGVRYLVAFPLEIARNADPTAVAGLLRSQGFIRFRLGGGLHELDDLALPTEIEHEIEVVVDRLVRGTDPMTRRLDSLETAFEHGHGRCRILVGEDVWEFRREPACARCGTSYLIPTPQLFNPRDPGSACPQCSAEGIIEGGSAERTSPTTRQTKAWNLTPPPCIVCGGSGLRPEALAVLIDGRNIADILKSTGKDLKIWADHLEKSVAVAAGSAKILDSLRSRLNVLGQLSLGHVSLDRKVGTLSAGESRRARLASILRAGLVNVLVVIDDPSEGLHPNEIEPLIEVLRDFRKRGNTAVVVSNEPRLIRSADLVVDLGPGAGERGGEIVYFGPPEGLARAEHSITRKFMNIARFKKKTGSIGRVSRGALVLEGAKGRNLKEPEVRFPLGLMCVTTGVGGSGKSSLLKETLLPALLEVVGRGAAAGLAFTEFRGADTIGDVALVESGAFAPRRRTIIATGIKAFDEIRKTFAETREAKIRGYSPGHFSLQVEGGRCTACSGTGSLPFDMRFLAEVNVQCPLCQGRRYRPEVLEIQYHDRSIAEVLDMTAREALGFFRNRKRIQAKLRPLLDLGLDYLRLGQSLSTLSTGEWRRLRLARILSGIDKGLRGDEQKGGTVLILENPSGGLHSADVVKLLEALGSWLDRGKGSLLIIDHHPLIIEAADWIIELGPGAGKDGGRVIAQGPPEELARGQTPIGRFLNEVFTANPTDPLTSEPWIE